MSTAPDLSPAEAARVAVFDAAPTPPEVVVETVARELAEAEGYRWDRLARPLADPSPVEEAVQREDPGWLYNELSGVLYGPDPDHPGLRYPFVTNVEAVIGHRLAEAMNRAALASPAPAPQGGEQR